ncbi:MAG: hypothetical protein Q8O67_09185 [Deltaproteobacteria bacterium]|nr:hypothetical protein [Deltaproteobacteria bacterium]
MIVAFDLGGVLVDVDEARVRSLEVLFVGDSHDRFATGHLDVEGWLAVGDRDLLHQAWSDVVGWSAGGLELLRETSTRAPCLVWSNTDPIHWAALGPATAGFVDDVALSFRLGFAKPDPRFFARALGGRDPASVLFLDDRVENVAGAVAAGVDAVLCRGVAEARAILRDRGVL